MRNVLFFCFLIFLNSCNSFRPSAAEVLKKSEKNLSNVKRLRYNVERLKVWQGEDTTVLRANVILLKDSAFQPLGYKVKMSYPKMGELRFNGDTIYSLDAVNHKLWITEVANMGTGAITGSVHNSVIGELFTETDPYKPSYSEELRILKLVGTKKLDNQKCWVIESTEQALEQEVMAKYFISKQSYLPIKTQTYFRYQDQVSYTEWKISDVKGMPALSTKEFSKPVVSAGYTIEIVKPRVEQTPALLPNQVLAPAFKLPAFSRDTLELSKLKGKVVVLDFWYMSCPPCLKALPHLQQLHEKYEAHGLVVLGINSKDNNEKDLKRLPGFLENRKLTYPVLLGSKEVDKSYAVTGYPSLYLIDKNGKIAYYQIGFTKEAMAEFEKKIEKLLKTER